MNFVQIAPGFAISRELSEELLAQAAACGIGRVVNLVPLEEAPRATEAALRRSAKALGLRYLHTPVSGHAMFDENILAAARKAFDPHQGPVLAACRTGQRAAILWAALAVEELGVEKVMSTLAAAGFDFEFLREELAGLAALYSSAPRRAA